MALGLGGSLQQLGLLKHTFDRAGLVALGLGGHSRSWVYSRIHLIEQV